MVVVELNDFGWTDKSKVFGIEKVNSPFPIFLMIFWCYFSKLIVGCILLGLEWRCILVVLIQSSPSCVYKCFHFSPHIFDLLICIWERPPHLLFCHSQSESVFPCASWCFRKCCSEKDGFVRNIISISSTLLLPSSWRWTFTSLRTTCLNSFHKFSN